MSAVTYLPAASQSRPIARVEPLKTGIWVGIFAITMSFGAFTSALYVREGTGDWAHLVIPPIVYANTLALLLSSFTLEKVRHAMANSATVETSGARRAALWAAATLILGLLFVSGQYIAWKELGAQGVYLATSPNSSFFYVFTVMHVLHVLGGIAALVYLFGRLTGSHSTVKSSLVGGTATYWHFMGVLWLYLLFIIRTQL